MLSWFDPIIEYAESILVDAALSKACTTASQFSPNITTSLIAEKSASLILKGPTELIIDQLSELTGESVDNLCGNEEESNLISNSIGHLAGLGSYLLAGGGIQGAFFGAIVCKTTESSVRKGQLNYYQLYLEQQDKLANEQAIRDLEEYGYSAPGF